MSSVALVFTEQPPAAWILVLAGSLCALPVGLFFLRFVRGRMDRLLYRPAAAAEGEKDMAEQEELLSLFDRVVLGLLSAAAIAGGILCGLSGRVYYRQGWRTLDPGMAWVLGGFFIFFGLLCLVALLGRDATSRSPRGGHQ